MPQQYFYKAMDHHGMISQGYLTANNNNDLEARLERMGLDLIHYRANKPHQFRLHKKVARQELITFCFHMFHLTRAGVPLVEGLCDLRDSLPPCRMREIVSSIVDNIEGGEKLSEALAHYPETFDSVFVNLIAAGEESGQLSMVFEHLTETLKWHDELVAKTKKLLMYPIFMGVVIMGALFFLMTYLVPQMVTFIENVQAELPWYTKLLMWLSNFMTDYWYIVLFGPILTIVGLKVGATFSVRLRFWLDYLLLKSWIFGPIFKKIILARFANFFALLYSSGITVLDSLSITKSLAGNLVIENALEQVANQIVDGVGISESFERANLFPPLVLRMVKVGESTGELDSALMNVSYFYNREVKEAIEKIQTLIEPVMTVILGLMLAWIMIAVLGPIYDIISDPQLTR